MTQLPEAVDHPAVRKAAEEHAELTARAIEARREVDQLRRGRVQAVERDREQYAGALRAGKRDPGQKAVADHDKRIAEAERKAEALALAATQAEGDLAAAVAAHRDELRRTAEARAADARDAFAAAVEAVAETHAALGEALTAEAWVRNFPDRVKLNAVPAALSRLEGLRACGPRDESVGWAGAVEALRAHAPRTEIT